MKTIVAFLQNMWVKDPEGIKRSWIRMEKNYGLKMAEKSRRRCIAYALFRGCLTGRRLRLAFGDLCDDIVWEETTREIADNPRTIFPAQPEHIKAVLETFKPIVVITFGKIAADAVGPLWTGPMICTPHPAARQPDTLMRLKSAADGLRKAKGNR